MLMRPQRALVNAAIGVLLVAFCAPFGAAQPLAVAARSGVQGAEATAPVLHQMAPDFVRTDLAGRRFRLSNHRGKVILVSFWATWCEPCLSDLRPFSLWQKQLGSKGFQVVGISMDDMPSTVENAIRRYKIGYPIVMGDDVLADHYGGVLGLPLSFLIDRSGRVAVRYQGEAHLLEMRRIIEALLADTPPSRAERTHQ